MSERALVNIYDPQVVHEQIWMDLQEASPLVPLDHSPCPYHSKSATDILNHFQVKKQVTISSSALEASQNADAIVIATEWKEFNEIDWEGIYKQMNKPAFVFDGRLLVDAQKLTKIGFRVSESPYVSEETIFDQVTQVTTIGRPSTILV